MVTIDHNLQVYTIAKGCRSDWRDRLLDVTIKGRTVLLSLEVLINNYRVGWVNIQARLVFTFQVIYNMQSSYKMSLAGVSVVSQ